QGCFGKKYFKCSAIRGIEGSVHQCPGMPHSIPGKIVISHSLLSDHMMEKICHHEVRTAV
ncbi:MAG: hypothetical protein KBA49_09490, partial [Methanolinea sp.]|nr:hypothetical protein [Methanolinea sp.]